MSHARASDARPQYFGGDLLTHRSDGGLRMSEVDYGSARAWAPHTHWRAFFALLIRGSYVEALGRTELGYRPLDLGFHPESTRHTDRIAADDTRFFLLELDESWIRRLSECGGEAALAPRICGGRSHELALRLYREFRADDPDIPTPAPTPTSWTEGLALELLAGLLPRGKNRNKPSWLARVLEWTRSEHPRKLSVSEMARQVHLHPVYLSRAFRDHVGRTVSRCLLEARLRHAMTRLADPEVSLAEVALDSGFSDQSHFTRVFKRETGMTPGVYRPARNSRTSSARSSGSSIAAKWPPRGISVQRTTS